MQDDDHGRTPVDPNVTQQVKFDAVCMQFEQAWRRGSQPKIESFSEESPVARPTDRRTRRHPDRSLQAVGAGRRRGLGVVYVAEQQRPVRRKVTLTIIKPGMDTKQVVARFEAERQTRAMMDHPNIARVLAAPKTSGPTS